MNPSENQTLPTQHQKQDHQKASQKSAHYQRFEFPNPLFFEQKAALVHHVESQVFPDSTWS